MGESENNDVQATVRFFLLFRMNLTIQGSQAAQPQMACGAINTSCGWCVLVGNHTTSS